MSVLRLSHPCTKMHCVCDKGAYLWNTFISVGLARK